MAERDHRLLDTVKLASAWTAGLAACALAAAASAQSPRGDVSDKKNQRSVTVDLSVLDALGPRPTVPQLLLPTVPRAAETAPQAAPPERPQPRLRLPNVSRPPALVRPGGAAASSTAPRLRLHPPRRTATAMPPPNPPPPKPANMASVAPPEAPEVQQQPARRATPSPPRQPPQSAARPTPSAEAVPPPPPPPESIEAPPGAVPPTPAAVATTEPPAHAAPQSARPSAPAADSESLRLIFDKKADNLSEANAHRLDPQVAMLKRNEDLKLRISAYASGEGGSSISARRMSLSRALAVRSYLMDKGISATRLEVRALGNRLQNGPADRVDTTVVPR